MFTKCLVGAALALASTVAVASETVTYSYDAKGRLTTVAHSGAVNNNVVATYTFDPADNRAGVSVTGSAFNSPASRIIVVPLRGGTPVPVPAP